MSRISQFLGWSRTQWGSQPRPSTDPDLCIGDILQRRIPKNGVIFRLILCVAFVFQPYSARANPTGETIIHGVADIVRNDPGQLIVHQHTDKAIIDWATFSIGASEGVTFLQPSSSSLAVNRVVGNESSNILGQLTANGRLMLINPNGILFGAGSRVDVNSLIATTIDISNERILSNDFTFDQMTNPAATIVNRGTITAAEGGLVALVAPGVENTGVIQARLGTVSLASGHSFTLDLYGDGLVKLPVDAQTSQQLFGPDGTPLKGLVNNSGTIQADGGTVLLTAQTATHILDRVINMDGIVQANSVAEVNGQIVLSGGDVGVVEVAGTLKASGNDSDETGGTIKVLGEKVGLFDDARVDVSGNIGGGEVLIGGNFQGKGPEQNAQKTYIGEDVKIDAHAETAGDGGRVIVWADETTQYYGDIAARGGDTGGHGGFAEVSGKQNLDFQGTADLTAANGDLGTLLLDPTNVIVATGGGSAATDVDAFADPGATLTVDPGTLDGVGGNVTLQATNDITFTNDLSLTTGGATLTAQAQNDINVNANITTNGATVTLSADDDGSGAGDFTIAGGSTVTTGNSALSVTANDMTITGSLDAGTGAVTLLVSDSETIDLGTGGSGGLNLSSGEIDQVIAGMFTIGDNSADAIVVSSDLTPVGTTTLHLQTGAGITATAGGIIETNLAVTAGGAVTFSDAQQDVTTLAINTSTGNIAYTDANAVTVGTVDGVTGVDTNNGTVALSTTTGTLTVSNTAAANDIEATGAITLTAVADEALIDIQATADVESSGGAITVTADDINLAGTITNIGRKVTLAPETSIDADVIDLGPDASAANRFELADADIDNVTAGTLVIGSTVSGALTVEADISPANTTTLHLQSGGIVTDTAGGIIEDNLAITAASSNSVLDHANNNVTTFAADINGGNSITFTEANGFSVGTVDGIIGTNSKQAILTATTGNLTINDTVVTQRGGSLNTLAADALLTINAKVSTSATGARFFTLKSDRMDINAQVDLRANKPHQLTVMPTTVGNAINLGSATNVAANTLELDAAELALLDAKYVVIGATDAGNIIVSADATLAGTVSNRLLTGGTITATTASGGGIIAASRLGIDADGAVEITEASTDVDDLAIFTTTGNITFTDLDGFNITTDTDTSGAAVVTGVDTNNGAVALTATTGNITVINTANANDIEATGVITLTAAANEALVDIQATADVESSGGAITVIADDINLAGTITNTGRTVTLAPETVNDADVIDLGPDAAAANRFELAATDIDNVTAGTLIIGSGASGDITVEADITPANTTTLHLQSGGGVTGTAGGLVGTNLAVTAGGTVNFTDVTTDVDNLAVSAAGQTVTFVDTDDLNIDTVNSIVGATAATLNLTTGGALTDAQAITATNLSITNTSAATTLDVAANDVDNLAVSAGGQTVTFVDTDDLDIDTVNGIVGATAATLNLTTGGALTDAQAITATNFSATAGGAVTLDIAATDVDTLAIDTSAGNVAFTDADGFSVGTVNGVTGVDTDAGTVALTATTGTLTVSNTAAANDVEATGDITLSAAADEGQISVAASADVESSGGAITVTADDINLAGTITNTGRTVTLAPETTIDADVIDLGPDASAANRFELTDGDLDNVIAGTLVIGSGASGAITVEADITPANTTTLHLQSGGGVTGTAGGIVETNLAVTAGGTVNLSDTTTDVDNLAISAAGQTVTVVDADDLDIDTVNGIVGVTAATLNLTTGGALTDTQAVTVTNLSITNISGTTTLDVATTDVDNLAVSAAGQTVTVVDTDDLDIDTVNGIVGATAATLNLTTGGALTDTQAVTATNLSITNTSGTTTLDVATNDVDNLAVSAAGQTVTVVDADDLDIDTVNGIVGATAATLNLTTGGALTDAQAITATNLSATAGGAVTLDTAATDVDTLAIDTSTGNVAFTDADGFTVGTVNGVTGVDTDAGTVALTATTGTLTVSNTAATNDIDATGDITLLAAADEALIDIQATADVESSGGAITVIADDINLAGTITNTGRTVTLAPETTIDADVIDLGPDAAAANRFELAAADIDKVTAGTLVIGSGASGAITVEADITPANTTTLHLQSGGGVTGTAGGIVETNLAVTASGTVNLSDTTTDVDNLAISAAGQTVTVVDADDLDIDTVNGIVGATATTLNLTAAGTLTDSQAVTVTNLSITNTSGTTTLDVGTNDVDNLAVSAAGQTVTVVDADDLDIDTVNGIVGVTAATLNLTTGGALTDTQAVTVTNLSITNISGTTTLDVATTDVDNLAVSAAGQTVTVVDTDDLNIDTVNGIVGATAATLNLTTGGALTDTQAITATNLSITNTSGTTTLDVGTNDVDNLAVSAAGQTVTVVDADDLDIDTVNGIVGATAATLNLTTGGALTDAQAVTSTNLSVTAGGAVTLDIAANDVDTLAIDTSTGNVAFTDADGFTVGTVNGVTGVDTDAGTVALTVTTGTLTVSNTAAANDVDASGDITLTAAADEGQISVAAFADVESSGGAITVTADDINLAGTITNTGRTVTLAPETTIDADVIDLGPDASAANRFELTDGDLDNVIAGTLVIGSGASGAITVEADITPANTTTLHLQSGGGVTGTAGGIVETNLAVTAGGAVAFSDTTTDVDNLAVSAAGQTVSFVDTDDLDIDTVSGVVGVTANTVALTTGGAITDTAASTVTGVTTITAGAGNDVTLDVGANDFGTVGVVSGQNVSITDQNALTLAASTISGTLGVQAEGVTVSGNITTAGATTIDADVDNDGTGDFTIDAATILNTTNRVLSITANDMFLNGNLNSGTASTSLLVSDGGGIGLGAMAGDWTLSGAELVNITATGLTVGDSTSGNIMVDGITAAQSNNIAGTVTLNATGNGRSVTFANSGSTFNALTVNADDGIAVSASVTTDVGALALDGDADNTDDGNGADNISVQADITSAGVLVLDATTGGIGLHANSIWTSGGLVTINDLVDGNFNLTVNAGTANIGFQRIVGGITPLNTVILSGGALTGALNATALQISGTSAILTGTVNWLTGQQAANAVTFTGSIGAGPYTMNGFAIQTVSVAPASSAAQTLASTSAQQRAVTIPPAIINTQVHQTLLGTASPSLLFNISSGSSTPQEALSQELLTEYLEPNIFQNNFRLLALSEETKIAFNMELNFLGDFWSSPAKERIWPLVWWSHVGQEDEPRSENFQALQVK